MSDKLQVIYRSPEEMTPYANNARTHSEEQIAQIMASIKEFGFVNPILIDERGVIIAGHGRLSAAKRLGMSEVPVIEIGHLSETQRKALIIADNRIALNAGWDEELLKLELETLKLEDFDLDLLGFDEAELDDILFAETEEAESEEVPAVPEEPVSKRGDLWILGSHRLLCGDATILTDVEKLMDGQLADMVFTDPPYNVDYGNTTRNKLRAGKLRGRDIMNDNLGDAFEKFLYDVCVNALTVTKGAFYVCMSSSELHTLRTAFITAGGHWSTFIIWAKNHFTMGGADYQRQYEPMLYGWKDGIDRYWCGARDQGDVWFIPKPARNDLHPTMKPVALVERAVKNSSKTKDIVLDIFGGSGTTLIACEKLDRQCRMMELDPKYVDVIVQRWEQHTGKKATHAETGEFFERK
ncbi:MAG: site-specific DNA-methyltransferase [Alphaproteobacteria bacterium]|nr:site-specific DNA-methyltransferase [Alphaproteobacteria bacterium]